MTRAALRERIADIKERWAKTPPAPWRELESDDYYQGGTYIAAEPLYHYAMVDGKHTRLAGPDPKYPLQSSSENTVLRVEHDASTQALLHAREDVDWLLEQLEALL